MRLCWRLRACRPFRRGTCARAVDLLQQLGMGGFESHVDLRRVVALDGLEQRRDTLTRRQRQQRESQQRATVPHVRERGRGGELRELRDVGCVNAMALLSHASDQKPVVRPASWWTRKYRQNFAPLRPRLPRLAVRSPTLRPASAAQKRKASWSLGTPRLSSCHHRSPK